MPQSKETRDLATERLLALNVRLMESLFEAGVVRIRLLKARDVNVWPDFASLHLPSADDRPQGA